MSGHLSLRHERTPNAHPHGGLNPYAFVAQGYRVFPCRANKAPRNTGWQQQATTDPTQIEQWLADGVRVFGLPTGAENNLFVLDLDTDKQTGTCIGEVAALELPWGDALLAVPHTTTPTGGRHIYFRHFNGARNTQGRLGQGIDTRGEGGYVVAPGSQTMAGKYRGVVLPVHKLPNVPLSIRASLVPPPTPPSRLALGAPKAGSNEVEALLRYIPPDCGYGDWLTVLMGLHDRYGGSAEGLAVADTWSAQGAKYKPGEVIAKWSRFKPGGGITWASVPKLAQSHGADLSAIAREFRKWKA